MSGSRDCPCVSRNTVLLPGNPNLDRVIPISNSISSVSLYNTQTFHISFKGYGPVGPDSTFYDQWIAMFRWKVLLTFSGWDETK